jgi:lipopolysaccharide transport system ATP-binding protein
MSSDDIAIRVNNLSKCYQIYEKPADRLKQFFLPRLQKLLGIAPKQYFKQFWALKDVSFEVKKGQIFGIIGRNGSGKSTLLQLISGTLNPSTGSVNISGRMAAILELGSGFNPEFTGRENIYLNASLFGLTNNETNERYQEIIDFADIGEFIDRPVKIYSSGMLVRLAFAVIAHVDADILLIDEALAVGDIYFNQKCIRFIEKFISSGGTILLVTHDIAAITKLCEFAIWLNKGKLFMFDTSKALANRFQEALAIEQNAISLVANKSEIRKKVTATSQASATDFPDSLIAESSFGIGGAEIISAIFLNNDFVIVSKFNGGEKVILRVKVKISKKINSAIVGFYIKDKYGQMLFGKNTWSSSKKYEFNSGEFIFVDFSFEMPVLMPGDYTVDVAIADGSQNEHTQLHWVHDISLFKSTSLVTTRGIVGIPIDNIKVTKVSPSEALN